MKLFGGSSKDNADKRFQAALNEINKVQAPSVEAQKVQLEQLVQQGVITPEEMEAFLQEDSGMRDIAVDPRFRQAQVGALQQLQDIATEGGLTATDKARLMEISDAQDAEERGAREALEQEARERGIGGNEFTLMNRAVANQNASNRAARRGMDVAALAEQRALDAIMKSADVGGNLERTDFDQQARIAAAQDAINQFNAATKTNTSQVNVGERNKAQQLNLSEKQRVADANTVNENNNRMRDADLIQQKFQNEMDKARAAAGVYQQWAGNDQRAADNKYASQMGAIGTGIGAAATMGAGAMGGPAAAGATGTVSNIGGGRTTNSLYDDPNKLPSDVMNKEEIEPADVDLDEFMISLQPYKYKYKDKAKHGDGEQHGVMAQDLAKTKTGAAIVTPTEDGLAIDTTKGFGVLAAALGRLNKKVEEKA